MGKFKEILRTGALLGGMMAGEGARGQEPLEAGQETQVQSENTKEADVPSVDEVVNEKIEASSLEDFKIKLKQLLKKKSEDPLFDPDEYEQHYLSSAISHFDDYKSFPGAEDFVVECGEKFLKDFSRYFFQSLHSISNPLPEKLEKLVVRAAQEYPLEALQENRTLERLKKIYPQIILATLNRKALARYDLADLRICFEHLLQLTTTHPAYDTLREVLAEKITIKAKEDPDELLDINVGYIKDLIERIFSDQKSKEEFYYTFLGGLMVKNKTESIVGNFVLFAEYEMCRPLLFAAVQKMPERMLEIAESQLIRIGEQGKSSIGAKQELANFYFAILSEGLEKAKVGEGETDYKPSERSWAYILYYYPEFFPNLKVKFGDQEKFKKIFGKDAKLESDPFQ